MATLKVRNERFVVYYWHESLYKWIEFYRTNDKASAASQADLMKRLWNQPTKIEEVIA